MLAWKRVLIPAPSPGSDGTTRDTHADGTVTQHNLDPAQRTLEHRVDDAVSRHGFPVDDANDSQLVPPREARTTADPGVENPVRSKAQNPVSGQSRAFPPEAAPSTPGVVQGEL